MNSFFDKYIKSIERTEPIKYTGNVTGVKGLMIESLGPRSVVGEICTIHIGSSGKTVMAEVVGFENKTVHLMAYDSTSGIEVGDAVVASGHLLEVGVGSELTGRILDATGRPCDGKGDINVECYYPAIANAPDPLKRKPINRRITTGIRSIDSLMTIGKGQRVGIFAGSGVGKSTIISSIAKHTDAKLSVIALIGERGREVNDLLADLGPEGLSRSILVNATGDKTPIAKIRAAYVATAVAEYFRDKGEDVLLMFDTVTRFAHAQRDVGTSNGESPQRRGYPASVFTSIQQLLERTGTNDKGSITALYTVLVDGGDLDEPVSDTVRGILDGHIVLSRKLAQRQHYPAVDVNASVSRLISHVNGPCTLKAIQRVRRWMSTYEDQEEMIMAGVYQKGNSVEVDDAIAHHDAIEEFLCQEKDESSTAAETLQKLSVLSGIEIPPEEYPEEHAEEASQENLQTENA